MSTHTPLSSRSVLLLLSVPLLLAGTLPASGQEWARKMFTEFSHDFGTVTREARPVHKFVITNPYKEEIRIANVFSSCGCTSVSLTKNTLKTNETAEVVCRYNTHLFTGFKQATVTVRFADPFPGEVQLTVKGNIVEGMNFSAEEIEFGSVRLGEQPQQSVKIWKASPNFRIVDVTSTFPHISVSLREVARYGNQAQYEMTAKLKESAPLGFNKGELFIVGQDRQQRITMPLKFSARVVPPLQLSPDVWTLNDVEVGQTISRKIVAKADVPFRIVDVTCSCDSFQVSAGDESKKVHIVDIHYICQQDPGRHEWDLVFKTDLGDTITCQLKAIVEVVPAKNDAGQESGGTETTVTIGDAPPSGSDKSTEGGDRLRR